ncbi:MAG: cupin domain-containing protein [Pseudomonadota bacterium]
MTDLSGLVTRLDDLPNLVDQTPGHTLRRFGGTQVMMQEAVMPTGTRFDTHCHHNEQMVLILSGRVRLYVGQDAEPVELGAGDMMLLPPNMPHGGEALEDCRLIDAFSPPRTAVLGEEEPE